MVEQLKQSVENLEPPVCANCHVEMKWMRSSLVQDAHPAMVAHFFHCLSCGGVRATKTTVKTISEAIRVKSAGPDGWKVRVDLRQ